ncbi:proteasome regulatory particle subunit [Trichodelitschia bisporula]|uniref:Proteasome regulatory particle subunit n=1 Tax=Trichodelitschia bisporula TaxID=703511 RepID=A0A6G1HZJ9_9PEZI|nr:proteasome regulatory particle subunit [Trichodelitschia bisporula]
MANLTENKYAIHEAAREGKSSVVESLLNAHPQLADLRDEDDRLPLHWAISYNHLPIVLQFMQSKNFDPDAQDGLGWTYLMMACSRKEGDDLVDLLLQKGADTALHFTASKNNLDVARKLVAQKASARIKDRRQQLPLHRAAAVGSVPMIRLLLDNHSPINATDVDGMTALHHAISEGHADAAVFLLRAGAEADKRDRDGNLAIQLAPDGKVRDFVRQHAQAEGIALE